MFACLLYSALSLAVILKNKATLEEHLTLYILQVLPKVPVPSHSLLVSCIVSIISFPGTEIKLMLFLLTELQAEGHAWNFRRSEHIWNKWLPISSQIIFSIGFEVIVIEVSLKLYCLFIGMHSWSLWSQSLWGAFCWYVHRCEPQITLSCRSLLPEAGPWWDGCAKWCVPALFKSLWCTWSSEVKAYEGLSPEESEWPYINLKLSSMASFCLQNFLRQHISEWGAHCPHCWWVGRYRQSFFCGSSGRYGQERDSWNGCVSQKIVSPQIGTLGTFNQLGFSTGSCKVERWCCSTVCGCLSPVSVFFQS